MRESKGCATWRVYMESVYAIRRVYMECICYMEGVYGVYMLYGGCFWVRVSVFSAQRLPGDPVADPEPLQTRLLLPNLAFQVCSVSP